MAGDGNRQRLASGEEEEAGEGEEGEVSLLTLSMLGSLPEKGAVGGGPRWRCRCGGSGQRGRARDDVDGDDGRATKQGRRGAGARRRRRWGAPARGDEAAAVPGVDELGADVGWRRGQGREVAAQGGERS